MLNQQFVDFPILFIHVFMKVNAGQIQLLHKTLHIIYRCKSTKICGKPI